MQPSVAPLPAPSPPRTATGVPGPGLPSLPLGHRLVLGRTLGLGHRLGLGHVLGLGPVLGPGRRLVLARLADVSLQATAGQLPGGTTLQNLTNGIGGWALILSLVGLVVGAALWALGAHSQNFHQSFAGRRAVLVSGVAALLIGAAPALINFFFHTGLGVH